MRPGIRHAETVLSGPLLLFRPDFRCATVFGPDRLGSAEIEQSGSGLVGYRGVATVAGALVGFPGGDRVTLLFEERAEIERAPGVAATIPPSVGLYRPAAITLPFQQHPEVASGTGMAAPNGPPIGGFSEGRLAALLEHDAEVERGGRVAARVGARVGIHRLR